MESLEFEVELRNVVKRYGDFAAVRGVTLGIHPGEMFSLLGPSGCGKTTTLRIVAGFVHPSEGEVVIKRQVVNQIPSYRRNTAMVFQNYALFPHLTVFENVAFGLQMRKTPSSEIGERVRAAIQMVRLQGYERSYPRQLSGGQQQRVALARALVVNPDVLLLDEPLSNLDAKLRQEVRVEIRDLVKRLHMTALYVTHDQEEALAISDRMAVMQQGVIDQVGTPHEIYDRPATLFVAGFIGAANILPARVVGREPGVLRLRTAAGLPVLAADGQDTVPLDVTAVVRPERIVVAAAAAGLHNRFRGRVVTRVFVGETTHYHVEIEGGTTIRMHRQNRAEPPLPEGALVEVGWDARDVRLVAMAGAADRES